MLLLRSVHSILVPSTIVPLNTIAHPVLGGRPILNFLYIWGKKRPSGNKEGQAGVGPSVPQLIQLSWQPCSNSLLIVELTSDKCLALINKVRLLARRKLVRFPNPLAPANTVGWGAWLGVGWLVRRFIPHASPQCHLDNGATYQLERHCRWGLHFITLMTKNSVVVSYVYSCLEMELVIF